ncbi:hypothetical protein RCH33_1879 [Flavobacterium daejeonense]|nr:hypothetical protein RCH33_1879 [Flavobacterium daejeonense]
MNHKLKSLIAIIAYICISFKIALPNNERITLFKQILHQI